jgi:hypothetical protein
MRYVAYLGFDRRVRMRSLVSARYRLSVYEGAEWGELYDLGEDPHETANLWDDAGRRTLRGELADAMVQAMIAHSETSPYPSYIA